MRIVERSSRHVVVITESEEETRRLGAALGQVLRPGDVVALHGNLGAGKTRFVQGIARGMGIERPVTSPTFILMNVYRAPDGRVLCHVDTYRLRDAVEEGYEMGLDQQFRGDDVCVVEWAERVRDLLPADHLWVDIGVLDEERRRIVITARGKRSGERLRELVDMVEQRRSSHPFAPRG